jgi:chemotaxis protein MotB
MKKTATYISLIVMILFFASCIPMRKFQDLKSKNDKCEEESTKMKSDVQNLTAKYNEIKSQNENLQKSITSIERDTTIMGISLRKLTSNYDQLNKTYELLLQKNQQLLAGNVSETEKLASKLQITQLDLQKKEDELKKLAADLDAKKINLDELSKKLTDLQTDLQTKEKKLNELQSILDKKDSVVKALKDKVSSALLGFEGKGLTVNTKNGKVYVSLEESLLFATSSIVVDEKGADAIKKLAKVLETNQDINIVVEGHTDNVPYKSGAGCIKDNWELSVMRAISIIKIMTANSKIDHKRLTAAGRGEYFPINPANTKEARAKNRRTEIILTPKLDELFQILETN